MSYLERLKSQSARLEEIRAMSPEEAYKAGEQEGGVPLVVIVWFTMMFLAAGFFIGFSVGASH